MKSNDYLFQCISLSGALQLSSISKEYVCAMFYPTEIYFPTAVFFRMCCTDQSLIHFSICTFFIFPARSKILSRIKLIQQEANNIVILK